MSSSKSIDRVVEGLYCSCHDSNADFTKVRNNIALSSFANAIGGTLHLSKYDTSLLNKLSESHADHLPGGKYELGYSHLAKSHIESLLGVQLRPVSGGQVQFSCHQADTKHFICKSCCPACRSASRGCPLHCCKLCWVHLRKLDDISRDMVLVSRTKDLTQFRLDKFVSMVTNDPAIPNGKRLQPNKGYFHNDMDVAFHLYSNYVLKAEYCKDLIHQLAAM